MLSNPCWHRATTADFQFLCQPRIICLVLGLCFPYILGPKLIVSRWLRFWLECNLISRVGDSLLFCRCDVVRRRTKTVPSNFRPGHWCVAGRSGSAAPRERDCGERTSNAFSVSYRPPPYSPCTLGVRIL